MGRGPTWELHPGSLADWNNGSFLPLMLASGAIGKDTVSMRCPAYLAVLFRQTDGIPFSAGPDPPAGAMREFSECERRTGVWLGSWPVCFLNRDAVSAR